MTMRFSPQRNIMNDHASAYPAKEAIAWRTGNGEGLNLGKNAGNDRCIEGFQFAAR
jgi:hypothetical protein